MSVDLRTHEAAMRAACKEVADPKVDTDWALFGYEGQTNTLKLQGTGEDGLIELTEDFNPSKVQYAFLKVEDPKTSLPKFVLINWQGETVPGSRKGSSALHLRDVEKFFVGHHVTMTVRNEDELDMEQIMEKVAKSSSTTYNFKEKPKGMELSPKPVGTAYKKIVPSAELPNIQIRESFWQKDQSEEKMRILAEREKKIEETKGMDKERRQREEVEGRVREEHIKERERVVANQRQQEKKSNDKLKEQSSWEEQREADARDAEERAQRSDVMRRERTDEAQELIRQGGGQAKMVFQRNSSQGQMNFAAPIRTSAPLGPPAPIQLPKAETNGEKSQARKEEKDGPVEMERRKEEEVLEEEEKVELHSDIAPPPPAFDNHSPMKEGVRKEEIIEEKHTSVEKEEGEGVHHATVATVTGEGESTSLESYGTCAVALYDYQASDETEISFDPGQIISHIDQIDPGWWQGLGPQGNYGLFPANYVEIIDNQELQIM